MELVSIKEIRNKAKKPENIWFRIFYYMSSFIVWVSIRLRVTPNQLTVAGFAINITGLTVFLISKPGSVQIFSVVAIFAVAHVFDCADGHLAFVNKLQSERGYWLDSTLDIFKIAIVVTCIIITIMETRSIFPTSLDKVHIIALISAQGVLVDYAASLHAIKYIKPSNSYLVTQISSINVARWFIVRFILSHVREYGNLLLIFGLFGVNRNAALILFSGYGFCHYMLATARIIRVARLL